MGRCDGFIFGILGDLVTRVEYSRARDQAYKLAVGVAGFAAGNSVARFRRAATFV